MSHHRAQHTDLALKDSLVRDLYWAVTSPSSMQHPFNTSHVIQPPDDWFLALDNKPACLHEHMAKKNTHMLGTYFEALWEFYLTNNPSTRLLAKNVQVFRFHEGKNTGTVGELDFIYFCEHRQRRVHLEVAVKYYMGVVIGEGAHRARPMVHDQWIGPQCNDRLDIKYQKLIDKQALLAQTDEGRRALADIDIADCQPEIALKGVLFYPYLEAGLEAGLDTAPQPNHAFPKHLRPELAAPDQLTGRWCRLRDLDTLLKGPLALHQWHLLDKPRWLALPDITPQADAEPEANAASDTWRSEATFLDHCEAHFSDNRRPLMWLAHSPASGALIRLFVTPDEWPFETKVSRHLLVR